MSDVGINHPSVIPTEVVRNELTEWRKSESGFISTDLSDTHLPIYYRFRAINELFCGRDGFKNEPKASKTSRNSKLSIQNSKLGEAPTFTPVIQPIDFTKIVREAWADYDDSREISLVTDISAMVSTNHVYRIRFTDRSFVVAKLSYFGKYEHFVEDHRIINTLSNNLPAPFENFLARSLMKGDRLYVYRHQDSRIDAWVVFYRPVKVRERLPRRLGEDQIDQMAVEFAGFHKACYQVRKTLPQSSKDTHTDVDHLLGLLDTPEGKFEYRGFEDEIRMHCDLFRENIAGLDVKDLPRIPVFVDWNIGNFSLTPTGRFFSRWDYDWFRMSSRMMDFYFIARVVSDRGDRTEFSYNVEILMEDRFVQFLKKYHEIYPLNETELEALGEVYRFFLLNYVVKDGRYFFHEIFATKLLAEAFGEGLPSVKKFDADFLKKAILG